jgi:hypothetical protein
LTVAFKVGDVVEMTADALENYGEEWAGVPLRVTHVATKYMPAAEFYAKRSPEGYHPGFAEGVGNGALYDLETLSGESLNFSLYGWEVEWAQ